MDTKDRWRRLLFYLVINVAVSACTVWVAMAIWERVNGGGEVVIPTSAATPFSGGGQPTNPPATQAALETSGPLQTVTPLMAGETTLLEITSVVAPGDSANERVVIKHIGGPELSLENWTLQDDDGNVFIFPNVRLYAGGALNVWTRAGDNTVVELFWGLNDGVWESGDVVTLRDPTGAVHATFVIP